ncbi:hypothetical protein P4L29_15675 [Bacillus cereus]|nr:hypothetical protein [Bacillus cereus]
MYVYIVKLTHFTDETYHENVCVCPTKELAKEQADKLQKKKDPTFDEWKYGWEMVKVIIE